MKATEKIIMAAEEIFADYHFEHASVKMICEKAGVNIASVNYHFRTKKDLYLEVIASIYARVKYKIKELFEYELKERTQENWELFISGTTKQFILIDNNDDFKKWHKILFRELSNPSEVYEDIYQLYLFPIIDKLNNVFSFFFPEKSEKEIFMWLISMLSQIAFIRSTESLITKFYGPDFYKKENITEYSQIVSKTISNSLKVK